MRPYSKTRLQQILEKNAISVPDEVCLYGFSSGPEGGSIQHLELEELRENLSEKHRKGRQLAWMLRLEWSNRPLADAPKSRDPVDAVRIFWVPLSDSSGSFKAPALGATRHPEGRVVPLEELTTTTIAEIVATFSGIDGGEAKSLDQNNDDVRDIDVEEIIATSSGDSVSGVDWNVDGTGDAAIELMFGEEPDNSSPDLIEGGRRRILVNVHERNLKARQSCIDLFGTQCFICERDLEDSYGPAAKELVHIHHLEPLKGRTEAYRVIPASDLRPLCPNCHAVVHRKNPPYEPDEVKKMLRATGNLKATIE